MTSKEWALIGGLMIALGGGYILRGLESDAAACSEPYVGKTPQQRTWADLYAACRLVDSWLGSDIDGQPRCYPMGQVETP